MKKLLIATGCALLLLSCKNETKEYSTAEKQVEKYSIEQFMDNENASAAGFSFDNSKVLITSNRSGINNIYEVASEGGDLIPITKSDSASIYAVSYFPKDDRILFTMDGNGDEIYKLFVKDNDKVKSLTPKQGIRTGFVGWAEDGNSFYFQMNDRDPQFMDLYQMNTSDYTYKSIYQLGPNLDFGIIANNGKYITVSEAITTNNSNLYLVELATKKQTKINDTLSSNLGADFSLDSQSLYFITDVDSEFSYVSKYDIATGETTKVTDSKWDTYSYYFSKKGTYTLEILNEDAKATVYVTETATGKEVTFPEIEGQQVSSISFSDNEKMAILKVGSSAKPTNTYSYNLETKEYAQLTDVLSKEINQEDLVQATVVRFNSFDGVEIPAIYYQPHQASIKNKVPALVWVHGGPGGQSRQAFNTNIQYLVNQGYAVLAVNNRGSSGYGKTFFAMDDQNHGEKDLKDCIAGKDWLATQDVIDADKIGILGGSYGGYMTMAALTYAPEEFKVGVNIYGVTNWMRTLKNIPPWWASFKDALYQEMGDPNTKDSIRLKRQSPLFHTENVTKPLMVLQGAQDPRVLQIESDEIVAGVRKNGVPVEYLLFEDEGHGFAKKENQMKAYSSIAKFLDTYLKGESDTPNDGEKQKPIKIDTH
ncbi:putative peptidase [unidentified eubacterium SCB49]|nr:putative peptidase [unidentified eubacterium SCB49]